MSPSTTPDRLLDTAERLFAERGFDGTSVRDITAAASVNQAAIHYHFGSKEAVLRAATDRVVGPLNVRRHQLLDELLERDPVPAADDLLRIFLQADLETLQVLQGRPGAARLVGRIYSDPSPAMRAMVGEQFGETGARFEAALAAALPDLPPTELSWRLDQIVAVIVNLFLRWPLDGMSDSACASLLERLVGFLGAGLRAPAPLDPPTEIEPPAPPIDDSARPG